MNEERGIDSPFDQLLAVLKRRKRLAAIVFVVVVAAVTSTVIGLPDIYTASATILVDPDDLQGSLIESPAEGGSEPRFFAVRKEVLRRERLQELIDAYDLYPGLRAEHSPQVVVERMRRDIRVEPQRVERDWGRGTTAAFDIGYRGFDREKVASVANRLAFMFVEENDRLRQHQVAAASGFMKRRLDEILERMEAQERRIDDYRDASAGELPEQQAVLLAALERLNLRLQMNDENRFRTLERREALLREMRAAGVTGGAEENAQLTQLRRELAEARTRVTDRHPDVTRLRAQIAALEREPARGGAPDAAATRSPLLRQLARLDASLEELVAEERRLRDEIAEYERRIENIPRRELELARLVREYDATKARHASMIEGYERAQFAETVEEGRDRQFRVLDPAVVPDQPAGPNRPRLLVLGLFLAAMAAAGCVTVREQFDTSFHRLSDLKAFTGVPVVAAIPRIETVGDVARGWFRFGAATVVTLVALAILAQVFYVFGHDNAGLVWMLTQRGT